VDTLGSEFIDLYLQATTSKFPLNWVVSNTAVDRLDKSLDSIIHQVTDTTDQKDRAKLKLLFTYGEAVKKCPD